jgi:hypothetical protein
MTSGYPKQFDELIAHAQRLSRELGAIPSQNKLKAALHVRAERARSVLNALRESGFDPTEPANEVPVPRRLHVVPKDSAEESATGTATDFAGISGSLPLDVDASSAEPISAGASEEVPAQANGTADPVPTSTPLVGWTWPVRAWRRVPLSAGTTVTEPVASLRPMRSWPVVLLAAPAFVAIWSGWVGLGALTGFGLVHPLPGIADGFTLNSAITLPVGVEAYAAYALRVWLATGVGADSRARRFAKWSAVGALVLGAAGQIAYHLMVADHVTTAPWWITTAVSCLPVVVLGFGAALAHLQHPRRDRTEAER